MIIVNFYVDFAACVFHLLTETLRLLYAKTHVLLGIDQYNAESAIL